MKNLVFLLVIIAFVACQQTRKTPYLTLSVNGTVTDSVCLYYLTDAFHHFDTGVKNKKGEFEFFKDSIPAGFYQLVINSKPAARMVLEGSAPASLNATLNINGNSDVVIHGGPEVQAIDKIEKRVLILSEEIKKAASIFSDSIPQEKFKAIKDSVFNNIDSLKSICKSDLNTVYESFSGSLVQMVVLMQRAGNHQLYSPTDDAYMFATTDSLLMQNYSYYAPVLDFHNKVDSLKKYMAFTGVTAAGKTMPIFELPDAWGNTVSFSQYAGKKALVVAWLSGSGTSREVTKKLMSLTRNYRRKGLELLMISLDTDAREWKKAIRDDGLAVKHISDLKGMSSPIVKELGINKCPLFWIVNEYGTIEERCENWEKADEALSRIIKN